MNALSGFLICVPWGRLPERDVPNFVLETCEVCKGWVAAKKDNSDYKGIPLKYICGACMVELVDRLGPGNSRVFEDKSKREPMEDLGLTDKEMDFVDQLGENGGRLLIDALRSMKEQFRATKPAGGGVN